MYVPLHLAQFRSTVKPEGPVNAQNVIRGLSLYPQQSFAGLLPDLQKIAGQPDAVRMESTNLLLSFIKGKIYPTDGDYISLVRAIGVIGCPGAQGALLDLAAADVHSCGFYYGQLKSPVTQGIFPYLEERIMWSRDPGEIARQMGSLLNDYSAVLGSFTGDVSAALAKIISGASGIYEVNESMRKLLVPEWQKQKDEIIPSAHKIRREAIAVLGCISNEDAFNSMLNLYCPSSDKRNIQLNIALTRSLWLLGRRFDSLTGRSASEIKARFENKKTSQDERLAAGEFLADFNETDFLAGCLDSNHMQVRISALRALAAVNLKGDHLQKISALSETRDESKVEVLGILLKNNSGKDEVRANIDVLCQILADSKVPGIQNRIMSILVESKHKETTSVLIEIFLDSDLTSLERKDVLAEIIVMRGDLLFLFKAYSERIKSELTQNSDGIPAGLIDRLNSIQKDLKELKDGKPIPVIQETLALKIPILGPFGDLSMSINLSALAKIIEDKIKMIFKKKTS